MTPDPEKMRAANDALAELYEAGRLQGQAERASQFSGKSAGTVLASAFASAMEQAAGSLAAHDPDSARFFEEEANRLRQFSTPLRVASHDPDDLAVGIVTDAEVYVRFDGPIREDSLTAETFYVGAASGGQHLNAQINYDRDRQTATLAPENDFSPGVEYRVTVEGVRADGGLELDPPLTFSFTTES